MRMLFQHHVQTEVECHLQGKKGNPIGFLFWSFRTR